MTTVIAYFKHISLFENFKVNFTYKAKKKRQLTYFPPFLVHPVSSKIIERGENGKKA